MSRRAIRLGFAAVLLLSSIGCTREPTKPTVVYAPDVAGIVATIDTEGPGTRYELTDGRVVSTEGGVRMPGSSDPAIGDLLVSGSKPAAWLHGLRALDPEPLPAAAACYAIVGNTWTSPTHVFVAVHDATLGDALIAFPKAPEWTDVSSFEMERSDRLLGVYNCVNAHGQITEHRFGQ